MPTNRIDRAAVLVGEAVGTVEGVAAALGAHARQSVRDTASAVVETDRERSIRKTAKKTAKRRVTGAKKTAKRRVTGAKKTAKKRATGAKKTAKKRTARARIRR